MPIRFVMRLNDDLLGLAEQYIGESLTGMFSEIPYLLITVLGPTEFTMKFMSEEDMLAEFKDDSTLEILN